MSRRRKINQLFSVVEKRNPKADLERLKYCLGDEVVKHPADSRQRPGFLYLPFLPSKPWHEPASAQWVLDFEAASGKIADECSALYRTDRGFLPYREPGEEARFWTGEWNACYFFHSGRWFDQTCAACPVASGLLANVPRLDEYALFSALKPTAHVRPHCGPWNTRLTYHFGISVPSECWIRVGDQTKRWQAGKFIVFDDSFEHEVMNDGPGDRIVLMFTVWHPDLTDIEIEFLREFDNLFPVQNHSNYVDTLVEGSRATY